MAADWSKSYDAKRRRAAVAASLPLPCCRCKQMIEPGEPFHLDHYPVAAVDGGTEVHPAHKRCNLAAGSALGKQRTRERRAAELEVLRAAGFQWPGTTSLGTGVAPVDPVIARMQHVEPSQIW